MTIFGRAWWLAGFLSVGGVLVGQPTHSAAENLRILSVETFDEGAYGEGTVSNLSVDLSQGTCGEEPDEVEEPFFDTVLATTIENPLNAEVTVTNVRYRLRSSAGGRYFRTRGVAPASPAIIESQQSLRILSIFLKTIAGAKKAARTPQTLSSDLGVQNMSVIIELRDSTGRRYQIKKRVAMAFGDYNRCP